MSKERQIQIVTTTALMHVGRVNWQGPGADDGGGWRVGSIDVLDLFRNFEGKRIRITIEALPG